MTVGLMNIVIIFKMFCQLHVDLRQLYWLTLQKVSV